MTMEDNNNDDNGNSANSLEKPTTSASTTTKALHVEYSPPKSVVVVWILMAAELGFNLGTSIIAFAATVGDSYCCGYTIYLGPLPLTTTIPFFFLILTELGFLGRAILLTLFPSKFGGSTNNEKDGDDDDMTSANDGHGFEVKLNKTTATENDGSSNDEDPASLEDECLDLPVSSSSKTSIRVTHVGKPVASQDLEANNNGSKKSQNNSPNEDVYQNEEPEYVDDRQQSERGRSSSSSSFCRRFFCCCLKWNAKMVLTVLNFLTLANPFFGCIIAWMLLYQSDKAEAFVVLGLEGISIILHFISVRLEGGLRTWPSRLIHCISLLPFFITVILMLVYLREGGVCYVVEDELFKFSGCEVCEDGSPPINGMCGDVALEGAGGVVQDVQEFDITNLAALAQRGATQQTLCSAEANFCWYTF